MEIIGDRILIRPLILQDVYDMRNWGTHSNPLFADYNFSNIDNVQIKRWYRVKTKSFFNKYYGIILKGNQRVIGFMSIKKIKFIRKESTLGIVFDPNFINQGYGTEALNCFLKEYFTSMNMRRMYLEVTEFNKRAKKVYRKMGFERVGYYLEEFFDSNLNINNPYFKESKSCFVINEEKIYNYIYKMKLDRETFLEKMSNTK